MRRVVSATVLAITVLICAYLLLSNTGNPKPSTEEESLEMAREFVINSQTFRFDGIEETLVHVETLHPDVDTPHLWEFVFTFKCSHAGYGDRSGQILAQVITSHTANVVVQEGKVTSAILDGKWDMIKREMMSSFCPACP